MVSGAARDHKVASVLPPLLTGTLLRRLPPYGLKCEVLEPGSLPIEVVEEGGEPYEVRPLLLRDKEDQ